MDVLEAIRQAESLLPGEPVEEGQDPRWQAIIAVGEHIESDPEVVWSFIRRWGSHRQEDLRDAVATCLLEHLLEHHFTLQHNVGGGRPTVVKFRKIEIKELPSNR
jgi:hypothetical protein